MIDLFTCVFSPGLAAGLGAGAVAEVTRRTLGLKDKGWLDFYTYEPELVYLHNFTKIYLYICMFLV